MLQKIDKALARSENFINGSLMLLGVIVLTVNVLMRYIFHMASTWVEEALRYSIIWVTFFGSSQCAKNGLHVGIDIFAQSLPETGKRIVTALGQFIAGILCGFCTYAGYFLTTLVMSTMQKSPAILLPMWLIYLSVPLGFALMTIRFFVAGVAALQRKSSGTLTTDKEGNVDLSRL